MERLDSYAAIEKVIQQGDVMLSDLERLLESLYRQHLISTSEQETLLELAWTRTIDHTL